MKTGDWVDGNLFLRHLSMKSGVFVDTKGKKGTLSTKIGDFVDKMVIEWESDKQKRDTPERMSNEVL